jgi:hypothetical protein
MSGHAVFNSGVTKNGIPEVMKPDEFLQLSAVILSLSLAAAAAAIAATAATVRRCGFTHKARQHRRKALPVGKHRQADRQSYFCARSPLQTVRNQDFCCC